MWGFFMTKEFTRKVKGLKLIYFNILPFIEVNSHGEFFFFQIMIRYRSVQFFTIIFLEQLFFLINKKISNINLKTGGGGQIIIIFTQLLIIKYYKYQHSD